MKKGFIYNKEIGGSHKSAAVYVEILEQHELPDTSYIEQWDCPHCGAIKTVYKTE